MEICRTTLFDKSIYGINLLDNHADVDMGSDEQLFTDGWYGAWDSNYSEELKRYLKPEISLDELDPVQIDLAPELQGYGNIQYANTQYPFDGWNPGQMGEEIQLPNPCMLYAKDFIYTPDVSKRCILCFKGVESGLFLYVNGKFAGYSENLYLDTEFDLTPYLTAGKNRIGVLCFKYCTSTWLLDQDFFRFSGSFREVTLQNRSIYGVEDVEVYSQVDFENRTAQMTVKLKGDATAERWLCLTREGTVVWQSRGKGLEFTENLTNIDLWSSEIPNLYELTVKSLDGTAVVQSWKLDVGFRHVEIQDGVLKLNGKRLIVNGVNRHEWNMHRGRSVTQEDMTFDVDFFKSHNINAVRTSHYPNHYAFYRLCNRKGLYMVDEACLESHGSFATLQGYDFSLGIPGDDPAWDTICQQKLLRMYERDKNHPAVIIWSLGNEAGYGEVFFRMRKALKARNPQAIVQYEQGYGDEHYMTVSDIYCPMYVHAKDAAAFIENGHSNKPYIHCEYEHAMGNSLGNMDTYRALLEKYPSFQGGFVWDYIDQGLMVDGRLCYGGDNQDRPNDLDFCCNGILFADRALAQKSAKAASLKYSYQPVKFIRCGDGVRIENRNLFIPTDRFCLELLENGQVYRKTEFSLVINPGESAVYPLTYPRVDGELSCRISTCDGLSIEQWIVQDADVVALTDTKPEMVVGRFNLTVTAGQTQYFFTLTGVSYGAAGLTGIRVAGEEYLTGEVTPTIFRPNTSNDIGCGFRFTAAMALGYEKALHCPRENISWRMDGNHAEITYRYIMEHDTGKGAIVTYRVDGKGIMQVSMTLDAMKLQSLPRVGLHLPVASHKHTIQWFGLGPWESYPDRKQGIPTGIWESTCQEEYVPYIYPQECANHEDTRYVKLLGECSSLRITGQNRFAFSYLPYSNAEIENATHIENLPHSSANHLTLCGFSRGVGGDDSWGSPVHDAYTLPGGREYTFAFYLIPEIKE